MLGNRRHQGREQWFGNDPPRGHMPATPRGKAGRFSGRAIGLKVGFTTSPCEYRKEVDSVGKAG